MPIDIDGITYVSSTRENYYTRLIFENYFEHVGMNYVVVRTQHSWIADKLDIGRAPAVLLSMSNFKFVTSFGLLIKNYICTRGVYF